MLSESVGVYVAKVHVAIARCEIKAAGIGAKFLRDITGCLRARAKANVIGDGECGTKGKQRPCNNRNLLLNKPRYRQ